MVEIDILDIEDVMVCKCGVVLCSSKVLKIVKTTSYSIEKKGKCPVCKTELEENEYH